jgi:hypothetical protein
MRSGKDAAAQVLVDEFGFTRLAFADQLKREVAGTLRRTLKALLLDYDAEQWPQQDGDGPRWTPGVGDDETFWDRRIAHAISVKQPAAIRALLQEWGTELRRAEEPDYWLMAWCRRAEELGGDAFVIPDVRFPNEAEFVAERDGLLIKIVRPGMAGDSHASERSLDGWDEWDAVLANTGTLEELQQQIRAWWGTRR